MIDLTKIDERIALYASPIHRGNPTAVRYVEHARTLVAEVRRLRGIEEAVQTLIDALPKCVKCRKPQTRVYENPGGSYEYCDDCSAAGEVPHAEALRALIALLGAK